ncbi:MAG: ATP-binding protein [Cyanobacteriota/Melainabacteria group bacterium]
MIDSNIKMLADKDRLVQVLINFLSNAIKFSAANSSIVIKTEALDEDRVRISVTDKGRGIPEEKLGDVFERFKQVDKSDQVEKGGTGLGLPISKTIVEQHGGEIGVTSKEGEGSTFWFIV